MSKSGSVLEDLDEEDWDLEENQPEPDSRQSRNTGLVIEKPCMEILIILLSFLLYVISGFLNNDLAWIWQICY